MNWFSISLIIAQRYKDEPSKFPFEVWENFFLIQSQNESSAMITAQELGAAQCLDEHTINDEPGKDTFEGVRQFWSLDDLNRMNDCKPQSNILIAKFVLEFCDSSNVESFLRDDCPVPLRYLTSANTVEIKNPFKSEAIKDETSPSMWHCAHIATTLGVDVATRSKRTKVLEELYLISADNIDHTLEKAKHLIEAKQIVERNVCIDGHSFKPIERRLRKLVNIYWGAGTYKEAITQKTEVSYQTFEVESQNQLEELSKGQNVELWYIGVSPPSDEN